MASVLGFLWILFLMSNSSSLMLTSATSDETCGPECELLKYCQSKDIDGQALKLCEIYMKNTESSLLDSRYQLDINNKNETKNQFDCNKKPPSSGKVWGYGMLCVTIISLMSVMGVSFLPLMSKSFYDKLLTTLIGLAIGSLFGSAVFHLIPAAFSLAEFEYFKHHEYLYNSLVIWFGVYLFFIIERILKICMEFKNHKHGFQRPTEQTGCDESSSKIVNNGGCAGDQIPKVEVYENSKAAMRASFGHMERPDNSELRPTVETIRDIEKSTHGSTIATVAWMIIFGDGVHNFIDGLSIGAAFSESIVAGISVSAAVLCEEFPHELGDFAVLLNSGMNIKQAMCYNFLSACTCYVGLVLGILLGEMQFLNQYIFAAAGGMFLYISLVDMVPELNSMIDNLSKESLTEALKVFLLQNIGMLVGIFSLFTLAKYQDDIQISF